MPLYPIPPVGVGENGLAEFGLALYDEANAGERRTSVSFFSLFLRLRRIGGRTVREIFRIRF